MLRIPIKLPRSSIVSLIAPFISACFLMSAQLSTTEGGLEYEIKAAFLLNFTKFVEWPQEAFASADSPLTICILGHDPFGHILEDILQGEAENGRRLSVRRLDQPPAPKVCQVIFVDSSFKETRRALREIGPKVLTVGESPSFMGDGGMIGFVIDNRRVRFRINLGAAQRAGLKVSSRLLSIAKSVEK